MNFFNSMPKKFYCVRCPVIRDTLHFFNLRDDKRFEPRSLMLQLSRKYLALDDLPRNAMGKVTKKELQKIFSKL